MSNEKGNLSINSENILPIIKKWLYSDSDIFLRELVSNATDAITKVKKLVEMGDAPNIPSDEIYEIKVILDKENKLIKICDNGIGMTLDEIKQYINQIAFSGASDFMEKYKDKMDQSGEIIGHFGLGFYSAFMVSDVVEIDSLSYKDDSTAANWSCNGGIEYEMKEGTRETRGTTITLHIGKDGEQFLDEFKLSTILRKYCAFMPVEIYFETIKKEEKKKISKKSKDKEDEVFDLDELKEENQEKATPINDTNPLWMRKPNKCTDEEYKDFYHKVFSDFSDPLFWIHLDMDYPFRLKGILYFPKLKHELESIEGQVKLYNNHVFIADNIKEVIPEFLLLLKGTIDCPDLPLNVSRSFLQNDGYVTKMSGYITKKVADKLKSIFKKDREAYNGYWDDISPFIKYGCIREKDFYEKIKSAIIFKTTVGDYVTLDEFLERNKDKTGDKVFYVTNDQLQSQYIKMFNEEKMEAVLLTTNLDNPFISYLESYENQVKFNRIDSDLSENLVEKGTEDKDLDQNLETLFRKNLGNENLKIKGQNLKNLTVSGVMIQSEQARRIEEMSKMFSGGMPTSMFAQEETLVLNKNNPLIKNLIEYKDDDNKSEHVKLICEQVYDLALMSHIHLNAESMNKFIERSNKILELAVNNSSI